MLNFARVLLGAGDSDKPFVKYSTSEMAQDLLDLLAHVGWDKDEKRIHLVGVSLGGELVPETTWA